MEDSLLERFYLANFTDLSNDENMAKLLTRIVENKSTQDFYVL